MGHKKFFKIFAFFLLGFEPTVFGGAAGGGAAQNANSDEARTAKPDERGADAMR